MIYSSHDVSCSSHFNFFHIFVHTLEKNKQRKAINLVADRQITTMS